MMKKQLQKFKLGVENLSRPSKPDKNSEELLAADQQVERYKDVLEKIVKKFGPLSSGSSIAASVGAVSLPGTGNSNSDLNGGDSVQLDAASREKRCKKLHEYRLAQAMEESLTCLPDGLLRDVLANCARLERSIANEIVDNESKVEASCTRKLTDIMDKHLATIQKQKRIVNKLMQDKESAKYKHQAAVRVSESAAKIAQLREEQEECETRLEKERDIWAAEMFELIAEEENMANYIVNYVTAQRLYYKSALEQIEEVMQRVDGLIRESNKRIFKVPLEEHLSATDRKIAHVIEMCVCCLLERGMNEEGLLRVGCAGSKLRRFRTAIDANVAQPPLPAEYNDVHVIAGLLKLYLRDLPDPLLTFRLYDEFVAATRRATEDQCKRAILNAVNQLPAENYANLRYLTRFLARLAENSSVNKMSSQNIAIVMSPNLLWSPATAAGADAADSASDYMQKVNSSTAVNRIVELLVADWWFFFDGEIEFYQTLRRDDLFRENGNGPVAVGPIAAASALSISGPVQHSVQPHTAVDIGEPQSLSNHGMTRSMNAAYVSNELHAAAGAGVAAVNHVRSAGVGGSNNSSSGAGGGHSRSNSHDTSLILLSGHLDQTKRSQSSSSLSDASSPPGQNSPKLPVRRKHNKQAAPTPPDTRYAQPAGETFRNDYDDHHHHNYHHNQQQQQSQSQQPNAPKPTAAVRHIFESTESISSVGGGNTASAAAGTVRPDKPPRPSFSSIECQTLNRSQYRSAKESSSSSSANAASAAPSTATGGHARPSALPKGMLFNARSTENLSDSGGGSGNISPIQLRGGDNLVAAGKPAIPERPISLMRPNSFKAPGPFGGGSGTGSQQLPSAADGGGHNNHPFGGGGGDSSTLKKTHSFRGVASSNSSGLSSLGGNGQLGKSLNNGSGGGGGGSSGVPTTLERTHIYNVDKKQVAIIDFVDTSSAGKTSGSSSTAATTAAASAAGGSETRNGGGTIYAGSLKITATEQQQQQQQSGSVAAASGEAAAVPAANQQQAAATAAARSGQQQQQHHVPASPRGFDPKIKRPQFPAPPPPIAASAAAAAAARPKSETPAGDSTNL